LYHYSVAFLIKNCDFFSAEASIKIRGGYRGVAGLLPPPPDGFRIASQ